MKRLLLISYNFSPELTGIGKYNGEMMEWLVQKGYDCSVLTAYPYYPSWKVQEKYHEKRFFFSSEEYINTVSGGKLKVYRCPIYIPQKPTGLKRMLLDFSFFITAFIRLITLLPKKKFDFVIAVAPSFKTGLLGLFYKIVRGSRLLYHTQDLQIEAARDLGIVKSKWFLNILLRIERHILKRADLVSSISKGMVLKVNEKCGREALLFPNWTSTKDFFPRKDKEFLKRQFGFSDSDRIVLYSGAIGEKQGLEGILQAALAHRSHANLKFVICGEGPYREKLVKKAEALQLSNVCFFPLQPIEKFNAFLNAADLHLVIQKGCASDLVMPSKLGAILAVGGLVLVTANEGTSLHSLIKNYDMGLVVQPDNQRALDDGIAKLLHEDFSLNRSNAREYAEKVLSINNVMAPFARALHTCCGEDFIMPTLSEAVATSSQNERELDQVMV